MIPMTRPSNPKKCQLIWILLAALVWTTVCSTAAVSSDGGGLQKGLLFMQSEKFAEAAKVWQADAEKLATDATNNDKAEAGVRYVLATIAYDRSEDAQAYGTWAKAIEIFLRSGSDWPTERDHLKTEIEENRAALVSVLNGERANLKTNASDLSLVNIDALVGLTKFDGPRRNLKALDSAKAADIEGGLAYIAKPLALQTPPKIENKALDNRSAESEDNGEEDLGKAQERGNDVKQSEGEVIIPESENADVERLKRAFTPKVHRSKAGTDEKSVSKNTRNRTVVIVAPFGRGMPAVELKGTVGSESQSETVNLLRRGVIR
jgi:hypothetical protein